MMMKSIQVVFSENLKKIRKDKGLSQQAVADKSDMLASTFNRIENMKVSPSIDTVERIAKALEVSIVDLFTTQEVHSKSIDQKLKMISNLSEYNQNVLEVLFDSIIEKDNLEKHQKVKMKKRLSELNKIRREL